jgi:dUTP pyrophosphatase
MSTWLCLICDTKNSSALAKCGTCGLSMIAGDSLVDLINKRMSEMEDMYDRIRDLEKTVETLTGWWKQTEIQVKYRDRRVEERAPFRQAMPGDAGYDLYYAPPIGHAELPAGTKWAEDNIVLNPNTYKLIPTGVSVKIPDGYVGLVCGRSSTFGKRGLFVVEGRIDSGYTGELFAKVWHPGLWGDAFQRHHGQAVIKPWERFAQLIVIPYAHPCTVRVVAELPRTERGDKGFGSTGV